MKKIIYILFATLCLSFLTSCFSPSPLYGTWADNTGSSIMFMGDNTYAATIIQNGTKVRYAGTYEVVNDVIVITYDSNSRMISEWDIRGGRMYLKWYNPVTQTNELLTLFHTSK